MRKRIERLLTLVVASVLLVSGLAVIEQIALPVPEAQAANAADFDPGNIISDAVFYNNGSMSAAAIQSFLNARVPSCRSGYTCLKDYKQPNSYQSAKSEGCAAYSGQGGAGDTAATIIFKVSQACGINPQVILVLLEKEQGLVSDDWPGARQYRSATGFGCPDTADCDANYYGFFNQVYHAAWQFKKYQARPLDRGYIAGRINTIRWNPDAGCGSSQVFIQNQATAGLYVYTPYRPNQAALNNLYGTGDNCSAYGNRNFWRMFTDWFGSTKGFQIHPQLQPLYNQSPGALGSATANATTIAPDGVSQQFQNGMAYWHPSVGAARVGGAILGNYNFWGGPTGRLGYPLAGESTWPGSIAVQRFQGGWLAWSSAGGGHLLSGAIGARYITMGAGASWLGYPLAGEEVVPGGSKQRFKGGTIYWSAATGAWEVTAAMEPGYLTAGGPTGLYKFPTASPIDRGAGEFSQSFSGRELHWSANTGALRNPTISQVGGSDRVATAIEIAKSGFPSTAPIVFIATGRDFPDALAAAPAAAKLGGPLLLTEGTSLPRAVKEEITRLNPGRIVIVGGVGAVSDAVAGQLQQLVSSVDRWSGADRFATSRAIARNAFTAGSDTSYLVTGWDFPDALAAAAAAGANGYPVVLVDGSRGDIDAPSMALLGELNTTKAVIGGGTGAVSAGIESSLGALGLQTIRLGGSDRFATTLAINTNAFQSATTMYLATAYMFPDALAGSAIAGKNSAPLYLVNSGCIPATVLWEINRLGVNSVVLFGGSGALAPSVARLARC